MKFDTLDSQPCLLPQQNAESCEQTRLPFEEGRLELRPDVAVTTILGHVQYRTFLIANGVEREVTSGLTYKSASQQIALIGAIGGNATGVAEGITTISVEWQGLEAFGQLQVVVSCDNISNGLMILIDNSSSMNQPFGGAYGTKLDFAKLLAKQFAGEVDTRKDLVGLATFGVSGQVVLPLAADSIVVGTAISNVQFVPEQTDITAGLQAAITALEAATIDRRVIILFTDGQHNDDAEPLQLAYQFRSGGGVIIAIGLRDGTDAFMRLEKLANGGFFISAYDGTTAEDAKAYVSGLKGYLCAGNCCPEGDRFIGQGKLNFNAWLNWNVSGVVDLIGKDFYDLLPGNGLFVDLVGSSSPWQGALTSKKTFTFTAGHNYRLSYRLAGNQRADVGGYSVRVIAGGLSNVVRPMDDWRQDFTTYTQDFVGNGTTGQILFLQETAPAGLNARSFGTLLDDVKLEDLTDSKILFSDNFDSENLTYIPPKCGTAYGYGYGYAYGACCYGYGCLAEPIKQQNPDPNPPADPEVVGDPFWVSTQSYTASCPVGTTGADVTRSGTYKSFISAADANARALALAQQLAEAALECVTPPLVGELINLHAVYQFPGLQPFTSPKKGFAAIGKTAEDFWNAFAYSEVPLRKSDGLPSMVRLRKCDDGTYPEGEIVGVALDVNLEHPDAMYKLGKSFWIDTVPRVAKPEPMFFDGLAVGTYEVLIYGHGPDYRQSGHYSVNAGKLNGNNAVGFTIDNPTVGPSTGGDTSVIAPPAPGNFLETAWADGVQYVRATVTIVAGQTGIAVLVRDPQDPSQPLALTPLMGIQIHRLT